MSLPPPPPPAAVKFVLKKPLKITKVERVVVEEKEEVVLTPEEHEKLFVEKYGNLKSKAWKLGGESDFLSFYKLVLENREGLCVAFDFDQTLRLRESIRGKSDHLLKRLHNLGVPFCIVTAAQPRIGSVKALSEELSELGLDQLFRTRPLDHNVAFDIIKKWGKNDALSFEMLERKLLFLFALVTDRRPSDLVRIGYSEVRFDDELKRVTYRMQRGPQDWGAELVFSASEDVETCLVRCLKEYFKRLEKTRPPPVYREIDLEKDMPEDILAEDKLFLSKDGKDYDVKEIETMILDFLRNDCRYPQWQIKGFMEEPAVEMNVDGIQMARYGNLIAAKYNKAEAVEYFMKEHPGCRSVMFVDDNFDNVFNVFTYFASKEYIVNSVWYEPPPTGRAEAYNEMNAQLLRKIWKTWDSEPQDQILTMQCSLHGFGIISFTQENPMAPLRVSVHLVNLDDTMAQVLVSIKTDEEHDLMDMPDWGDMKFDTAERQVIENFAFTLFGDQSIKGATVALEKTDGTVIAEGVIEDAK